MPSAIRHDQITILPADASLLNEREVLERHRIATRKATSSVDTLLSGGLWVCLTLDSSDTKSERVLELRTLRLSKGQFQLFDSAGNSVVANLEFANAKGGLAIRIPPTDARTHYVVGRITPHGVSRPRAMLWNSPDYQDSELLFERSGGALLGSFLGLAFLGLMIGVLNRDWSFFLFAGWLVTSLRVTFINEGWDFHWIGLSLDPESTLLVLRLTLSAHPLLTTALFVSLLGQELEGQRVKALLEYSIRVFALVVVASPFLPHGTLLNIVWVLSALGICLIMFALSGVVRRTRSTVSYWYAGSWGVTFAGALLQVGYASGVFVEISRHFTVQFTGVASALLTAVALAERLRVERSARVEAQKGRLEVLEELRKNYDATPIGLFKIDQAGEVQLSNPAFREMFSIPNNDLNGGRFPLSDAIGPSHLNKFFEHSRTSKDDLEFKIDGERDEDSRWFSARMISKGAYIEGSIQEITTRKIAESRLRHLVDHDSLTGLLNRRGLEQAMQEANALVKGGVSCAVAHVSIDRFKLVNDLYGHATGDAMLMFAASQLQRAVRTGDRIARLADSFVVVFLECPDFAVMGLSERLREAIGDFPFEHDGKRLDMTASVGVVGFDSKMTAVDTMAAAGRACAEAKARGRNCVVRLDDGDARLKGHLEELKVVADLQKKIMTDRYFLDFQPIVALKSPENSLNYEILLRMRDERGNVIPPGRFIGAAERNGLMSDIDRWVLRSTLEWLDSHPTHRDRLNFATLNISGASLNDSRFVDDAFSMIADHPLAMPKLCFEITESVALNDIGSTRRFIDRVRMYGSKLALDDFGAGYTSFNYLKEIPADLIKIDGSFVRDINSDPANYAITRTIVDLTHELGMRSIAEWAETADTVASLIELGVDFGQGYGLARPMDKRIVTDANSCADLVKDPVVLRLITTAERASLSAH